MAPAPEAGAVVDSVGEALEVAVLRVAEADEADALEADWDDCAALIEEAAELEALEALAAAEVEAELNELDAALEAEFEAELADAVAAEMAEDKDALLSAAVFVAAAPVAPSIPKLGEKL